MLYYADGMYRAKRPNYLRYSPLVDKESSDGAATECGVFGSSSMQGWRKGMEDAHVALSGFGGDVNAALFAVFDGHNGPHVARYAAEDLPKRLLNMPEYMTGRYAEALRKSFLAIDDAMLADWPNSVRSYGSSDNPPSERCGCTAVACLVKDERLHVANAGDCRMVLCRGGSAIQLTTDHKPEVESERQRIEQAGGHVEKCGKIFRVNGRLSCSRGLGDFAFKNNGNLSPAAQMITAHADILTFTLTSKDEFIVLGCDGVWERRTSQDVIDFVKPRLDIDRAGNDRKVSTVAEKLLDAVVSPDVRRTEALGCDNMTCVIVDLVAISNSSAAGGLPQAAELVSADATELQTRPSLPLDGYSCPCGHMLAQRLFGLLVGTTLIFIIGFIAGVVIAAAGPLFSMILTLANAILAFIFYRVSPHLDFGGCIVFILCGLFGIGLLSLWLALGGKQYAVIFSTFATVVSLVIYIYESLAVVEDERKHVLRPCNIAPSHLEAPTKGIELKASPDRQRYVMVSAQVEVLRMLSQTLVRWLSDVVLARWTDIVALSAAPDPTDEMAVITVHNRTFKQIKVCLYAADDCLCWIPLGGYTGASVGIIPAEQSRKFSFMRRSVDKVSTYRVKVFQPGFLDIELGTYLNARGGDSFEFYDAEQLVTRRPLSPSTPPVGFSRSLLEGQIVTDDLVTSFLAAPTKPRDRDSSVEPTCNEIVVRNCSQQAIRASLFSTSDHVHWIPVVGKLTRFSDLILPDKEKRLCLKSVSAKEFTMQIYDESCRVLTYLTVSRGHVYTVDTSLLA